VLFIDPAAKRKSLYEFDHVPVTAPQYPDPIVLKASAPMEIPEGSVLCSAAEATMIQFRDKRVTRSSIPAESRGRRSPSRAVRPGPIRSVPVLPHPIG